jgi:uncharacterized protein
MTCPRKCCSAPWVLAIAIPTLHERVNDQAGVMRADDVAALNALLADLERTDSTQVVLLTVKTTEDMPIEDYALAVARKNGFGQKGKSNGVFVLLAVDDHAVRIEVGEGLEGRIPDTVVALIIKHEMVPKLRDGDVSGGARAGVEAVVQAVRGEFAGTGETTASSQSAEDVDAQAWEILLILATLFAGFFTTFFVPRWWATFPLVPLWLWLGLRFGLPGADLASSIGFLLLFPVIGLKVVDWMGTLGADDSSSHSSSWSSSSSFSSHSSSFGSSSSISSSSFSGGGGSFSGGGASGSW